MNRFCRGCIQHKTSGPSQLNIVRAFPVSSDRGAARSNSSQAPVLVTATRASPTSTTLEPSAAQEGQAPLPAGNAASPQSYVASNPTVERGRCRRRQAIVAKSDVMGLHRLWGKLKIRVKSGHNGVLGQFSSNYNGLALRQNDLQEPAAGTVSSGSPGASGNGFADDLRRA